MMAARPTIRLMHEDDIGFALAQTKREGWDIPDGAFQMHLAHDGDGCFVAEYDGEPVAIVTTTCYRRAAFIGNLIVEPNCRRQGVGEILMRRAMRHVRERGIDTVRLEADPPGVKMYRRLGFVDVHQSLRFERVEKTGDVIASASGDVQPLTVDDVTAIAPLDAMCFGDDRQRLLAALLNRAPAAYWIVENEQPIGYVITQAMQYGLRIGPCVAESAETAAMLIDAVLAALSAPRFSLGIPAVNESAIELLRARGFEQTPSSLRMVHGDQGHGGLPRCIFAITGGDRG